MKVDTKLGQLDLSKEGDRYNLQIPPGSNIANTMDAFKAPEWAELLEKCKDSGMAADEIMTSTDKDGNVQVLSSAEQKSLVNMINFMAEIAKVDKSSKTVEKAVDKTSVDNEMIKKASEQLGI